jgi:hypothetical protein
VNRPVSELCLLPGETFSNIFLVQEVKFQLKLWQQIRREDRHEQNQIKITVFWDVRPYSPTKSSEAFAAFIFRVDESLLVFSLSFLYTLHKKYPEIGD